MGYIKQITIQGFKSYKDQTKIEPFSSKSNIIVGRNGAGKSNFFAAVRFVLGDDYENMSREERQALLHEGSGSAVMSAYVEVIFDNSDGRFHNGGKPEFVLRRTIGAKKDEYSMDRKNHTKREVFEMLEAAGLSRSNPFYIVPQGRVTAITNMKDEERLNLLKEISGSNVYEKRRADSLKLLTDTDLKLKQIGEVVRDISERLQELEGEKKELEAWNKNDRERRALLYTMYTRDERRLEELVESSDSQRHTGAADVDALNADFIQNEREMEQIIIQMDELKTEAELLTTERSRLEDQRNEAARKKAGIELELNDLTDTQSATHQAQLRSAAVLKEVEQNIQARESELEHLRPQYDAKKAEESVILSQLAEAKDERKSLEDKQGRSAAYTTKRQRDDDLRKRIEEMNVDLGTRKSIQMQTADDLKELQGDIGSLEKEIARLNADLEGEEDNTLSLADQIQKAKDAQDEIRNRQNILFRDGSRLQGQLKNATIQLQNAERDLSSLLDQATSRGLESLRRLQKQHNLDGIYGPIAELIEVSDTYKIATEVAANNNLFNIVCDNDTTAQKAMELLRRDEQGGRLTFIPLNQVQPRHVDVPQRADAQPLLPKLGYDPIYENALKLLFGNVVVCPEIGTCQSLTRTHDLLALTPDGDRANKNGGYHGGWFDPRQCKLDAYHKVARQREELEQLQTRKAEIEMELDSLRQQLTEATSQVRNAENQKQYTVNGYRPMRQELRAKQDELQGKRSTLARTQQRAENIASQINSLGNQQNKLEGEIASDFKKSLTSNEEERLRALTGIVRDLSRQLPDLTEQRSNLESRIAEVEGQLREDLRPRLDQLYAQQNGADGSGAQSARLEEARRSLKKINKTMADFDRDIRELEDQRSQANGQLARLEESKAEKEKDNRQRAQLIEQKQRRMERNLLLRGTTQAELTELQQKIRELGTLPEEAYHKFTRWSNSKLTEEHEKVRKTLKKYSHVNKKAFQQYEDFTKKREDLTTRQDSLSTSGDSIGELIELLDQRKDEAIARTFKQVSKYFQDVFVQLVPAGKGRLIIQRRSDREARGAVESDEEDERANGRVTNGKKTSVENYTGVGIAVSFNSKHDEQQRIQQLSGGQKALCALALVFAIQQCDPAPFYLFDEIDANLDAQYRTAVAEMLHKLSGQGGEAGEGGGQFICTTFRPEMVLVADKCYAVSYKNSASKIDVFDREGALAFVETSQKA